MLTRIHDAEAAAGWGEAPDAWHERWKRMLAERTYAKDNPDDPRAATSKGGWWWTHLPLRRAYFRLERLFQDGTLFCFLEPVFCFNVFSAGSSVFFRSVGGWFSPVSSSCSQ